MKDQPLSLLEKSKILKALKNLLPDGILIYPDTALLGEIMQIESITSIACKMTSYKLPGDREDVLIFALRLVKLSCISNPKYKLAIRCTILASQGLVVVSGPNPISLTLLLQAFRQVLEEIGEINFTSKILD